MNNDFESFGNNNNNDNDNDNGVSDFNTDPIIQEESTNPSGDQFANSDHQPMDPVITQNLAQKVQEIMKEEELSQEAAQNLEPPKEEPIQEVEQNIIPPQGESSQLKSEKPSTLEEIKNTVKKIESNTAGKTVMSAAVALAVVAALGFGVVVGQTIRPANTSAHESEITVPNPGLKIPPVPTPNPEVSKKGDTYEVFTGYEEFDKRLDCSFSQYDLPGCFGTTEEAWATKVTPDAVGNPDKAAELIGLSSFAEATNEQKKAVFEYMTLAMAEPAAAVAMTHGFPGFENLDYVESAKKIDGMSQEEKEELARQIKDVFDRSNAESTIITEDTEDLHIGLDEDGNPYPKAVEIPREGTRSLEMTTIEGDSENNREGDGDEDRDGGEAGGGKTIKWGFIEECGNYKLTIVEELPDGTTRITKIIIPPETGIKKKKPKGGEEEQTKPNPEEEQYEEKDLQNEKRIDDEKIVPGIEHNDGGSKPNVPIADATGKTEKPQYEDQPDTPIIAHEGTEKVPTQGGTNTEYNEDKGRANVGGYSIPVPEGGNYYDKEDTPASAGDVAEEILKQQE